MVEDEERWKVGVHNENEFEIKIVLFFSLCFLLLFRVKREWNGKTVNFKLTNSRPPSTGPRPTHFFSFTFCVFACVLFLLDSFFPSTKPQFSLSFFHELPQFFQFHLRMPLLIHSNLLIVNGARDIKLNSHMTHCEENWMRLAGVSTVGISKKAAQSACHGWNGKLELINMRCSMWVCREAARDEEMEEK